MWWIGRSAGDARKSRGFADIRNIEQGTARSTFVCRSVHQAFSGNCAESGRVSFVPAAALAASVPGFVGVLSPA